MMLLKIRMNIYQVKTGAFQMKIETFHIGKYFLAKGNLV